MTPEEYAALHPKMFRVAFDFLNAHFPPEDTDEWWEQTAHDCGDASVKAGGNKLAIYLLAGVMDYLNDENMKRRNGNGKADN